MLIHFTCPHCGTTTEVADQYAGQTGPCIRCGKPITIPCPEGMAPFNGPPPKRGMGVGLTLLIVLGASVPVMLVCGGILVALLLPAVESAREAARRMSCSNNLKQIALAMHNYAQANNNCFPPAYIADKNGKPMHSWRVLILPYLEMEPLYKQYRFDEPWDGPHNRELAAQMPAGYRCPTHGDTGSETSYAMIVGPHAISDGPTPRKISEVTDGLSNTIMVAEAVGAHINRLEPRDLNTEKMTYRLNAFNSNSERIASEISSDHIGVVNVLFGDGHAEAVSNDIEPKRLKALTTIDGGESVDPNDLR
jgi:prepilin-type processing-associated H-X9-DG protein